MIASTLFAVMVSGSILAAAPTQATFAEPAGPSAEAVRALSNALSAITKENLDVNRKVQSMAEGCQAAVDRVAPQSLVGERLAAALATAKSLPGDKALDHLLKAAHEALDMLTFQPRREAALPEGFPTYTPAGVIEVKQYPASRMAVGQGFWPLFAHISRNRVAMTAPVQMEYEKNEGGKLAAKSMAFLYERADQGQIGKQGSVEVIDAPKETVVAIGVRGLRTRQNLGDANQRLMKWLEANPKYEAAGPVRVMGYNSPFVPPNQQFFEVQVSLKEVEDASHK